jgi:hypothetical protein
MRKKVKNELLGFESAPQAPEVREERDFVNG